MAPRRDKALDTARDIIRGMVCECGHTSSEHHTEVNAGEPGVFDYGACAQKPCRCEAFTVVDFYVERA